MPRNSLLSLSACALVLALGSTAPAGAQQLQVERIAFGFASPLWVGSPPEDFDRLFVCEQNSGLIKIIENGVVLATPFLDVGAIASQNNERGLLGLAFHPDYARNGRFFINYTDNNGHTRVVEYRATPPSSNVADPNAVQTILAVNQPFANHNGGCLQFGPDGMLYIGLGDGGSANDPGNRAQTPTTLLGKMLRLDVDLPPPFVPPDNPYVDDGSILDEIWAFGLRNPWRYSFDRLTGDLWIADVGQFDWEEVNFQPASSTGGENYGWRCMEATHCTGLSGCTCDHPSLTLPIHEYANAGAQCSVTGGFVYRGSAIQSLQGTYFFADYCSSRIWSFRYEGGQVVDFVDRTAELEPPGTPTINAVTSFGEDAAGELYIVDPSGGEIFKIVPFCGAENYCQSTPNSFGPGAIMDSAGSTSIAANDLQLVVGLAAANQFGLFFYGPGSTRVPLGDGFLCVSPGGIGLQRLNPPLQTSFFGDTVRALDFNSPPASSGPGEILPGSTWFFQFWFRDPMGPGGSGFNFSDGLQILFCP